MSEQSGKYHPLVIDSTISIPSNQRITPEDRFDEFVEELRALCREHGVQIEVGGHESILVFELYDGQDEITASRIVNYLNTSL
jgi:hypothetical protein